MIFRDVTTKTNYSSILRDVFTQKKNINPNYSLRAFAKFLDMYPSQLSQVMNNTCGLSKQKAREVCEKLGFNNQETEIFVNLVTLKHARSNKIKDEAKKQLTKNKVYYTHIINENSNLDSEWHYLTIFEMVALLNKKMTAKLVSKRLNIPVLDVEITLKKLVDAGYIQKEEHGYSQKLVPWIKNTKENRRFLHTMNLNVIDKIRDLTEKTNIRKMNIHTVLSVPTEALDFIELECEQFCLKINEALAKYRQNDKSKIYFLNMQFISPEVTTNESLN